MPRKRLPDGRKITGYNVYRCPDGCGEYYYGFARTLREARRMASNEPCISECEYETARKAGHICGIEAPDKSNELDEPAAWFGPGGWCCAVAIAE